MRKWVFLFFSWCVLSISAQSLRVATYNIRVNTDYDIQRGESWTGRKDAVARLIRFHDFDIFGVQEARFEQANDLQQLLPKYHSYGVGREDGKNEGEQCRIFFDKQRFTLLDKGFFWLAEENKPIKGWDASYIRICVWTVLKDKYTKTVFRVFNTHLDNDGVKARAESMKMLLERIRQDKKHLPTIIMGDFNTDQNSETYHVLQTSGIVKDAFTKAAITYFPNGTYMDFDNDQRTASRIDHLFVSDQCKVLRWGVLTDTYHLTGNENPGTGLAGNEIILRKEKARTPSDHYPVMMEMQFIHSKHTRK